MSATIQKTRGGANNRPMAALLNGYITPLRNFNKEIPSRVRGYTPGREKCAINANLKA